MNAESSATVGAIRLLPIRARVAFGLAVAELAVQELAADPEWLALAREALQRSWGWASGASVRGADLEPYIDSVTEKDLSNRELVYPRGGPMAEALSATICAVGYACRKALDCEGAKSMSDPLWAFDEEVLEQIVDSAKATSRYSDAAVQQVSSFLQSRYAGQAADMLGSTVSAAEILPLMVPSGSGG